MPPVIQKLITIAVLAGGLILVFGGCRPPPGQVACWQAEHHPKDSVGANDGSLEKGTTYDTGIKGQAFNFNAPGDAVSAPTQGLPCGTDDRTLACWVYIRSFPNTPNGESEAFFAGYGNFGGHGQTYQLGALADHTLFFSPWGNALFGPKLTTGKWHHVAASNTGSRVVLYLDGAEVAAGNFSFNTPPATRLRIGNVEASRTVRQTLGLIDEVAVYNRALTAAEIQRLSREK